jgi:hypothetical protein
MILCPYVHTDPAVAAAYRDGFVAPMVAGIAPHPPDAERIRAVHPGRDPVASAGARP